MREAAVIGKPISHSLSPSIFGFISHRLGLSDFDYRAHEVDPADLKTFIDLFHKNPNGVGFNVTIPHKEKIFDLLNEISPEAKLIGAVNVVHLTNNELRGYNTDVYGVLQTFKKHSVVVRDRNALLIGAGGAARAVAYALGSENAANVTILTPNLSRAKSLISEFQPHFKQTKFQVAADWSQLDPVEWSLIAQSTPLGMSSQPMTRDGVSALDYFSGLNQLKLSQKAWAFDLIYRPEWTPFLEQGRQCGLVPIGGLDMLIEQALETWRIWFGERPSVELSDYLRHRPIFLTGFMGAGKSTIGPLLARKLGWNFVEIDHAIESEAGLSIRELFKTKGEPFFRDLERKIIARFAFEPRSIISLGGGSLTHPQTRELLAKIGRLVFLTADLDTLDKRLKLNSTKRPLLAGLTDAQRRQKIESLLKEREAFYNQASFRLDTASMTAQQAAERIREKFL